MEPSSLVLVAIIGVWAAYLVPHWVRRREELAQSRTPDRFSDGLRVLQRRRRRGRSGHRSGDAVLTSPRVVVDVDGELLYIPGKRGGKKSGSAAKPAMPAKASAVVADFAARVKVTATVANSAAPAKVAAAVASNPGSATVTATVANSATPDKASAPVHAAASATMTEPATAPAASASAASASRPRVRPAYRSPAAAAKAAAVQPISVPGPAEVPVRRQPRELAAALQSAHAAARRRAVILALLLVITVAAGVCVPVLTVPLWVVAPSAVLLLLHLTASRIAAIRSAEHLAVLREQVRPVPASRVRPPAARPAVPVVRPVAAEAPAAAPDRVARRAIAVGAETWEPIPVPVPTYTLKPAVFRPEPPPLDLPAASAAEKPRGALPRRAEEIERILALGADPVLGLQERKAVNG